MLAQEAEMLLLLREGSDVIHHPDQSLLELGMVVRDSIPDGCEDGRIGAIAPDSNRATSSLAVLMKYRLL